MYEYAYIYAVMKLSSFTHLLVSSVISIRTFARHWLSTDKNNLWLQRQLLWGLVWVMCLTSRGMSEVHEKPTLNILHIVGFSITTPQQCQDYC